MMKLHFTKMNGLGNDFIIFDGRDHSLPEDLGALAKKVCDRHFGIGADGILVVLPSDINDIRMLIINSDGSEAQMCGNGDVYKRQVQLNGDSGNVAFYSHCLCALCVAATRRGQPFKGKRHSR